MSRKKEQIYEVEAVEDHRQGKDGQRQYLIKWKGYDRKENTWQSQDEMDAPDVIAEYWFKRKHTKQQYGDERFSKRQRLLAKSQNGASATTTKKGKTAHTKPAVKGSLAKRVTSKRGNSNNTAAALPPSPSTPKVGPRITFRGKRMKIADNSSSERNWKKDVVKIVKAKFLKDSGSAPIFLVVQWEDGTYSAHSSDMLRYKCPQLLIDFYEHHLARNSVNVLDLRT